MSYNNFWSLCLYLRQLKVNIFNGPVTECPCRYGTCPIVRCSTWWCPSSSSSYIKAGHRVSHSVRLGTEPVQPSAVPPGFLPPPVLLYALTQCPYTCVACYKGSPSVRVGMEPVLPSDDPSGFLPPSVLRYAPTRAIVNFISVYSLGLLQR